MKIFTDEFINWLRENYPAEKWIDFSCQIIVASSEVKNQSITVTESYARESKTIQDHYKKLTDN